MDERKDGLELRWWKEVRASPVDPSEMQLSLNQKGMAYALLFSSLGRHHSHPASKI